VRLLFLLLAACAPAAEPPYYPLHPKLRAASGGPITLVGEVAHPGAIPYAPGITFTTALRLSGGPTALGAHAQVRRGSLFFDLPLAAIVDHAAPDPELAPGDVITIQSEDD
jgi:protein involved in polysaccharide export with SLBB domain